MNYLTANIYESQSYGQPACNVTAGKIIFIPVEEGHITQEEVDTRVNAGEAVVLEFSTKGGATNVKPKGDTRWLMFGGTFVWSSDSRARRAGFAQPVPLHDRYEG